jgi:hypothetical protein
MKKAKKMFIPIPQPEVYYGINVDKKTKLEYENGVVKQRLEDLVLYTEQHVETSDYKTTVNTELYLNEGDLLLLEEEGRGYFKPGNIKFGSINEALKELRFIKEQMKKVKE